MPHKRKRKAPKNITECPDAEALEKIFGKRILSELKKEAQVSENNDVSQSTQQS